VRKISKRLILPVPHVYLRGTILTEQRQHVTVSELVRVHACPVRFYYEQNEPVFESGRYAVCKQLSYHLGTPLDRKSVV
jgi:CRISPR-associated exonuclease Cas4